jgi:MSHA biogenesis protein MshP
MNRMRNPRGARLVRHAAQAGFVLPSAIFLMVMLAALATYMVTLSRTSQVSNALSIQGDRAYQAARTGIEWAAWQVSIPAGPPPCPTSPTTLAPLGGVLSSFTVTVTCTPTPWTDGGNAITIYTVTSTATTGTQGNVDYVQRKITATFGR